MWYDTISKHLSFLTFPTNCNEGWKKKKEREKGEGKEGWRDEGREFELNYILISRPFRLRDMPNIRRNLHFKLDTSCHHEARGLAGGFASSGGGGCCRFAVKTSAPAPPSPGDGDFQKLPTHPFWKNQPSIHSPPRNSTCSSILLTFSLTPFKSTFQSPRRKFLPPFPIFLSSATFHLPADHLITSTTRNLVFTATREFVRFVFLSACTAPFSI